MRNICDLIYAKNNEQLTLRYYEKDQEQNQRKWSKSNFPDRLQVLLLKNQTHNQHNYLITIIKVGREHIRHDGSSALMSKVIKKYNTLRNHGE